MSIKVLLITLICSISITYGQNANTISNAANRTAETNIISANKTIYTVSNRAPYPTPTPLPSNTTIRGKVFFEDDGNPIRRTQLMFFGENGRLSEFLTMTDDSGRFELKKVPKGKYSPIVLSPGAISPFAAFNVFEKIEGESGKDILEEKLKDSEQIEVDGIKDLEVKIPVKRGGVISGKVTYSDGSPASGVYLRISNKAANTLQLMSGNLYFQMPGNLFNANSYQTDDRGFYRIVGLPPGEYLVSASENVTHVDNEKRDNNLMEFMQMLYRGNTFLNTYHLDAVEPTLAKPVKVESGKEQSNIDIKLPDWKLYKVSGKVLSSKDKKPVKAKVYLISADFAFPKLSEIEWDMFLLNSIADENGNWGFKDLPKGKYKLKIVPLDSDSFPYYSPSVANVRVSAKPVNSRKEIRFSKTFADFTIENSNIENLELTVGFGGTISGTLIFERENDFSDHFTIAIRNENDETIDSVYVRRFSDARIEPKTKYLTKPFIIENLPTGKLQLKISSGDKSVNVKTATANGVDLLSNYIELKEGQTLSNVRIVLEKKK